MLTFTDLLLAPIHLVTLLINTVGAIVNIVIGTITILVTSIGCLGVIAVLAFCVLICSVGF